LHARLQRRGLLLARSLQLLHTSARLGGIRLELRERIFLTRVTRFTRCCRRRRSMQAVLSLI
jgi:hypothetical protein